MGILNATPDSFSDAASCRTSRRASSAGAALVAAGADILDVGGESARGDAPAGPGGDEEIARVEPLIERLVGEHGVWSRSTPTSRRSPRRRSRRGRRSSTTSPGCATRGWPTCARAPARRSCHAHARRAEGHAARSRCATRTWSPTSSASCRAHRGRALAAAWRDEQLILDPGPGLRQDAGADGRECCGGSTRCARSGGRSCWPSRARTSSARSPAARRRERGGRTLAALAHGVDAGASLLRVHDVAAAADFLAVRAVLRGERELAPDAGLTPDRVPRASLLRATVAGRCHNAAGRLPTHPRKGDLMSVRARPLRARGV